MVDRSSDPDPAETAEWLEALESVFRSEGIERGHYLIDFVDQMTKINRGRAFYATPERLGEYILIDYVGNKRKQVR